MSSPRLSERLIRRFRAPRAPLAETVGPRAALAHQLALSTCLLLGFVVVDEQVLGISWLYWAGQVAVHLLSLTLLVAVLLSRGAERSPRGLEHLLTLLPVLDLLVLAICRWSVVGWSGSKGS